MILKPLNDKCNYTTFQLENKLNVMLVEDKDTDVACATMLVKIGHDHDTVFGIAHFLEHMLFNGTEKYPDENEYASYISNNGGMNNAYTDHDHTCYFFTVQPECLEKSLDMFGNFFISPLLNPNSIDRESNAVNAEHIKNIGSDSWRLQEIMRQAVTKTNPLKNFGTGSSKTLAIPDIDKKVRQFFENYYSSHLMTLFVVTKNNTENIKKQIIETFSKIEHKVTLENTQYFGNKIYDYPKIIEVVPIKNIEKLTISWDLPSYKHSPLRSPYRFLSHLLGHEGQNTIHHILCQKGYIASLFAGTDVFQNDRCTFTISVVMTPIGVNNKEEILFTIIEYIKLVKNCINFEHLEKLYNEQMTLDAFEFKYSIKNDSSERTLEYAKLVNTYDFNLEDVLIIPYAKENFSPNVKKNLFDALNEMTIEKSVILFVSKSYDGKTQYIDEDYGTNYNVINNYLNLDNVNVDISLLDLPNLNNFLSTGEEIISDKLNFTIPTKINRKNVELYYLPTNRFLTPDVYIKAVIYMPNSIESSELYVNTVLYFSSLLAEINHEIYMCSSAGYNVNVTFNQGKLYVDIFGNYLKIANVCDFLVGSLLNKNLITAKIFNTAVYGLEMSSANSKLGTPYTRVQNVFRKNISKSYYDSDDILSVLKNSTVSIKNTKSAFDVFLKTVKTTMLVSGNCNESLAQNIVSIFDKFELPTTSTTSTTPTNLDTTSTTHFDRSSYDIYSIPVEENKMIIQNVENKFESNTAVLHNFFISKLKYDETPNWENQVCILSMLDSLMSTEYFDQLRTKEGFGYVVNSRNYIYSDEIDHVARYYGFLVQSPHKTHEEIVARTNEFILDYKSKLQNTTHEKIEEIKEALISQLTSPFNNLIEMTDFMFNKEILSGLETFDFRNKLIKTYENIKLDDVVNFYDEKIVNNKYTVTVGLIGNKQN